MVAWVCISSDLKGLIQLVFNYSLFNKSVDLRSLGVGQAHPLHPISMGLIVDKIYYYA